MSLSYDDTLESKLKGQTVTKLELGDSGEYIRFTLTDGSTPTFYADGDCCSYTWINDLLGVKSLLNQPILRTEHSPLAKDEPDEENEDYEVIAYYGERFYTSTGYFDLLYRNSSNGYYGGSLEFCDGDTWRDGKPESVEKWQEITDDWTAS